MNDQHESKPPVSFPAFVLLAILGAFALVFFGSRKLFQVEDE